MENSPVDPPDAEPPTHPVHHRIGSGRWWVHPARWVGELATVFVGVYAAFMLSNYQSHLQNRQRRAQILEWARWQYSATLDSITSYQTSLHQAADEFNRRVKAGEMPRLKTLNFVDDYNATDFTSMLQSGGFDLLEVETVRDIRDAEGSLRNMAGIIQRVQQLSDTMILPNLEKPDEFFYDPATRRLRPTYAWYTNYFDAQEKINAEMLTELGKALAQIRKERERNR